MKDEIVRKLVLSEDLSYFSNRNSANKNFISVCEGTKIPMIMNLNLLHEAETSTSN